MDNPLTSMPLLTVSQLNQTVKQLLERQMGQVYLSGEISNFSQPSSGHWYFTLKDQHAQVRCAMFRNSNLRATFRPNNGQQVIVRCQVTLYEPRGDYQLIADQIQMAGDGLLQLQFAQLKQRLAAEGLFASEHKQSLPTVIRQIGIITSASGAALQDMLTILRRRDASLSVIIYPTTVQGSQAAEQIGKTIELANRRQECDVLIVGRGGGSLEDLACFNDEQLARTIFASQLPIISAVGHETDVTIADFVSDLRAPTPSAAAELVSQDSRVIQQQLLRHQQRLGQAFDYLLMQKQQQHRQLQHRLYQQHPQLRLQRQQQQLQQRQQQLRQAWQSIWQAAQRRLSQQQQRCYFASPQRQIVQLQQHCQQLRYQLTSAYQQRLQQKQQRFALKLGQLQAISPLATLSRGYSIALDPQQRTIKSVQQLTLRQTIRLQLTDGIASGEITKIEPHK